MPRSAPNGVDWLNEVHSLIAANKKIHAIKLVREKTGIGLAAAKNFVDTGATGPIPVPQSGDAAKCFPIHMRVTTPDGPRPIGALRVGDAVLSPFRDRWHVRPVTRVRRHPAAVLWEIEVEGCSQPIETTSHHSFQTRYGWGVTRALRIGDELMSVSGPRRVSGVRSTTQRADVVNLYTAGEHMFVVEGLIVHNFTRLRAVRTILHRWFIDPSGAVPEPCQDSCNTRVTISSSRGA